MSLMGRHYELKVIIECANGGVGFESVIVKSQYPLDWFSHCEHMAWFLSSAYFRYKIVVMVPMKYY